MNKTKRITDSFQLGISLRNSKKAIELSINFLVIVIISIVMLTSGILIIKKYFSTAGEIKDQLDEQTISQIEDLLDEGDSVAIPLKRKTIEPEEKEIFGLGVININDIQTLFNIEITLSNAYDNSKNPIDPESLASHPDEWLLYEDSFSLDPKEKRSIPILVSVPPGVISGTYIYNVKALPYDRVTKMYVIVP